MTFFCICTYFVSFYLLIFLNFLLSIPNMFIFSSTRSILYIGPYCMQIPLFLGLGVNV